MSEPYEDQSTTLKRIAAALEGLLALQRERFAWEQAREVWEQTFRTGVLAQQARVAGVVERSVPPPEPWQQGYSMGDPPSDPGL